MAAAAMASNALSLACQMRDYETVQSALRRGARPDTQTFTWACMSGDPRILDAVITAGAFPDSESLNAACASKSPAMVRRALEHRAPSTEKTWELACESGDLSIIDLVRAVGAERLAASAAPATPMLPSDALTKACLGTTEDVRAALARGARPDDATLAWACYHEGISWENRSNSGKIELVVNAGARAEAYDAAHPKQ